MANKKNIPGNSDDDTTTTGGSSTTSAKTTLSILGYSDTQIDQGVFDPKSQEILTKVSLNEMGNKQRQARKGKERVLYDRFGPKSEKENVENTEKAPQHTLANVLGLSNRPKPR